MHEKVYVKTTLLSYLCILLALLVEEVAKFIKRACKERG